MESLKEAINLALQRNDGDIIIVATMVTVLEHFISIWEKDRAYMHIAKEAQKHLPSLLRMTKDGSQDKEAKVALNWVIEYLDKMWE